jgi:wobble nucleotide-excising tRNase
MSFESTADALQAIKTRIDETNSRVRSHNETVRNLKQVRSELIDRCWKWIVSDEAAGILADYRKQRDAISKGVAGLEDKIRSLTSTLRTNEQELAELEAQTTSVEPTVREINEILLAFGFRSFRLSKAERPDFYKLVRPDGTDAAETLSDGERSFVTFLYFYHLLEGSLTASGVTDDRIVVFDDPVSSLDSDVLFIVSTLIKEILSAIRQGIGPIRQAFVLTHNVYFHREVTFRPRGTKGPQDRFWTLRKTNDVTTVRRHDVNPIKTGYEMLWVQVRAAGSTDPTIQNTLRRILESYFTLLGNVDSDEICAQFEGADKVVCKSLFSWVNSGSHAVHGDEYATMDGTSVSVYLDVFREVFVKTQHLGHYEMMMEAARPPVAE